MGWNVISPVPEKEKKPYSPAQKKKSKKVHRTDGQVTAATLKEIYDKRVHTFRRTFWE